MKSFSAIGHCGKCGHLVELATGINNKEKPKPNDITLCIRCGAVNQFNDDMSLRLSDIPEDADKETRQLIQRAQTLIRQRFS